MCFAFQLDAKNSPLALLAQTCSSIGKDPPAKSVIPPLERKDKNQPEKAHSVDSNKSTPPKVKDAGRVSSERTRPGSSEEAKDLSYFRPLSTSSPKQEKVNDQSYHKEPTDRKPTECVSVTTSVITKPISTPSASVLKTPTDRLGEKSPRPRPLEQSKDTKEIRDSPPLKRQRSASPMRSEHSPVYDSKFPQTMYPGLPLGPWGYPGFSYPPGLLPSSAAEAYAASGLPLSIPGQLSQSAHASALAAHQAALKSGASLSNYLQYARMRAPAGQPPLISPCRDPYCTNCLAAAQSAHLSSQCTSPGCAQCSHEKSLQNMGFSALGLHGSIGGLPGLSSNNGLPSASAGLSSLHSLYAHNLLTQQQGQPHICNWMSGNDYHDYCGKRFTTSEELLQHLRTHTSGGESALAAYGSLGISIPSPADISALHGYLGSAGNLSPGAIRRTYPSSLSPLSNSALHANRYHPYKSGLSNVPVGLPAPPSLGPYYSAYGLYGQRIGSAAVP